MPAFIPVAVVALLLWGLARFTTAELWHLLAAALLGVVLSGTVLGPDIHTMLSQLSAGHLH
jgi:H+/gluconate symporter-like permease